jgi:hypothetical protein
VGGVPINREACLICEPMRHAQPYPDPFICVYLRSSAANFLFVSLGWIKP